MRKTSITVLAAAFLVCGAGVSAPAPATAQTTVERIVAIVNDEIITMTDMNRFAERLRSGGLTDDMLIPDESTKEAVLSDRRKLLDKMIDEKVIDSEVKRQNLTVPIERVEQEIRSIAKRNNVSRDELRAALQERGVAFSEYQDFIKTGLERQGLIEKAITSRIKISEDDVLAAYAQAHGPSGEAFEYSLSHIYFSSGKGGAPAAKARAERSLAKLRGGANFEKLAADESEDPGFEAGGVLGTFKTGELQKDLEAVVQKLGAGEFSDVIPTRGGYHIVKVNKKRMIPDPRSERAREKIRAELYEKAYKRQLQGWLEQLRQEAFIRINDPSLAPKKG
jgi:peptidyl-prolyl cis-trans isomerase SurA